MPDSEKIKVIADGKPGFITEWKTITLTKGGVSIKIDNEDFREILEVLGGKKEICQTEEMDGYYPEKIFVWNK